MDVMRCQCLSLILISSLLPPAFSVADEAPSKTDVRTSKDVLKPIEQLITGGTVAIVHVDLAAIDRAGIFQGFETLEETDQQMRIRKEQTKALLDDILNAGGTDVYVVFWSSAVLTRPPMMAIPIGQSVDVNKLISSLDLKKLSSNEPLSRTLQAWNVTKWHPFPGILLAGKFEVVPKPNLRSPLTDEAIQNWLTPKSRPEMIPALDVVSSIPFQAIVVPNVELRQEARKSIRAPNSPAFLQGLVSLVDGVEWISIGIRHGQVTDSKPVMEVTIQMKTAQHAEAAQSELKNAAEEWASFGGAFDDPVDAKKSLDLLIPQVVGNQLVLAVEPDSKKAAAIGRLKPSLFKQTQSDLVLLTRKLQLKQLGLFLHLYHESMERFPAPATFDDSGKPLLSWRVMLLPILGEQELYRQFHLDEPWDSAHNRELIGRMPKLYQSGNSQLDEAGKTCLLLPAGAGTMFNGKIGPKINDLTDGTEFTVMAVEADEEHAVIWTCPEDLNIDPKQPLAGLARHWKNGKRIVLLIFADGSIQQVLDDESPELVRSLFTPTGNEPHPAWP